MMTSQTIRTETATAAAKIIPFPASLPVSLSPSLSTSFPSSLETPIMTAHSPSAPLMVTLDEQTADEPKANGRRGVQIRSQLTEAVQPIKDLEDIQKAKEYLLTHGPETTAKRNYMMFVVNINNAVRISDLLSLRIKDVATVSSTGDIKILDETFIRESKTKKTRYLFFGPSSKEAITMYLESLLKRDGTINVEDHLFAGERRQKDGSSKAISRQYAWKLISTMGHMISEGDKQLHLGTHSMRKTFGYQKIKQHPDDQMIVAQISEMYNHSSMQTTYRYLGIDTEEKRTLCTTNEL